MAKRWYYKDENGNKVPVPQYKIDADNYYTKAVSDSRYYEKSETDTLLDSKVSKSDIVQSTGTSTTAVMSQKAVSDIVDELESQMIYDVTANNSGATFDSLSALLSNENLSTLIPTSVRHGGMSIRFIQSSDNKYVQYRLMVNEWSTTVSDWQGVDDEPVKGSDNLVKSGGSFDFVAENIGLSIDVSEINTEPILYDNVSGWIVNSEIHQGRCFKCYPNTKYKFSLKEGGTQMMFSFLRTLDTSSTPDYATGTSKYRLEHDIDIVSPADANYLWVGTKYESTDLTPNIVVVGDMMAKVDENIMAVQSLETGLKGYANLTQYDGWLDTTNKIISYSTSKFVIIPCTNRHKLHITTHDYFTALIIATDYYYNQYLPITVTLATGETGRRDIATNTDVVIELPSDANYIYLQVVNWNDSKSMKPHYLSLDGIPIISDLLDDAGRGFDNSLIPASNNYILSGNISKSVSEYAGQYIHLEDIYNSPILYDDNGVWIKNSASYQGKYFECSEGTTFKVTPRVKDFLVSFLKSLDETAPDYVTGTQRISIDKETTLTAPAGTKYVWFMSLYGGINRIPTIIIEGTLAKEVRDIVCDVSRLVSITSGFAAFQEYAGWLDGDLPKIVSYKNSKFIVIPIKNRKRIHIITQNNQSTGIFIAKNYGTELPVTLELATGETGRRNIRANEDMYIDIPSDAEYMYMQTWKFNDTSALPTYLFIDNMQIIPSDGSDIDFTNINIQKDRLKAALTSSVATNEASHILTFIHTSDTHLKNGNSQCFYNIMNLLQEPYINCLVHTGDIVWDNFPYSNDTSAEGYTIWQTALQSETKDIIFCVGNHDVGGEYKGINTSGTDKQVYDTFYAPFMKSNFISGGTDKSYFYVDYDKKVRFISLYQFNTDFELDSNDSSKLKYIRGRIAYRQDEINWLCETLNNTPEGYAVFILTHSPQSLGNKVDSWQSRRLANSTWEHILTDIVNAYVNRTTVNVSVQQDTGVVGTITANYDFSSAQGYFAAFLNGHTHDDFVGKDVGNTLNVINKCCDNIMYQAGCSINHIVNTESENLINVVSINTQNRTITVFRVGGKYSADGDYRNVITLSY